MKEPLHDWQREGRGWQSSRGREKERAAGKGDEEAGEEGTAIKVAELALLQSDVQDSAPCVVMHKRI